MPLERETATGTSGGEVFNVTITQRFWTWADANLSNLAVDPDTKLNTFSRAPDWSKLHEDTRKRRARDADRLAVFVLVLVVGRVC